jgi:DNA-3-methyladenine glycosylase I
LQVLKPNRVICRIFYRLGLIRSELDTEEALRQGRLLAQATREPIRYIDIVFVALRR